MSSTAPGPRPREVTIGGWAIPVASAVLVVTVFDRMAGLQSVATRDALTTALTSGWAKGVGITVDDAITLIRAALFVSGTAAAITGILGIFVLQRHASARLALTVAAVPVVLTAPVVGGLLGIIIGISTGLLWTRPARDWFAGRPPAPREAVRRPAGPVPPASERWPRDGRATPPQGPPPAQAWVPAPGSPQPGPPAYPAPYPAPFPAQDPAQDPAQGAAQYPGQHPAPYPSQAYPGPGRSELAAAAGQVPTPVRIGCILTWIFSLLTGGVYLLLILLVAVDRGEVITLLRDNASIQDTSLSDNQLIGMIVAMSAIALLWCLAASLLAFLTWRRHAWAWVMLLISIGVAGLFELFALPFSLLHLAACVAAFVLLLRGPARAWISAGPGPRQPPSWPGGPGGGTAGHAPGWPGQGWPPPTGHEQPRPPVEPPVQYPPPPPPEQPPVKPPVW